MGDCVVDDVDDGIIGGVAVDGSGGGDSGVGVGG